MSKHQLPKPRVHAASAPLPEDSVSGKQTSMYIRLTLIEERVVTNGEVARAIVGRSNGNVTSGIVGWVCGACQKQGLRDRQGVHGREDGGRDESGGESVDEHGVCADSAECLWTRMKKYLYLSECNTVPVYLSHQRCI